MKTRSLALLVTCSALSVGGCYRTVYRNLLPPNTPPATETPQTLATRTPRGWQHFFIYGLFPSEREIDAAALCGGEDHVATVETQVTFLEMLASPYQIYTPWNAHVTCDHSPAH
ncbi:MAG: Bor/Iss family lipoprotein [Myxococcota bacterium]